MTGDMFCKLNISYIFVKKTKQLNEFSSGSALLPAKLDLVWERDKNQQFPIFNLRFNKPIFLKEISKPDCMSVVCQVWGLGWGGVLYLSSQHPDPKIMFNDLSVYRDITGKQDADCT